jgi:Terminase small subunit
LKGDSSVATKKRKPAAKAPWAEGLNDREMRFVEAYRATLCKAKAARASGYPHTSAAQRGHELMERPHILRAVDLAFADSPGITRSTLADVLAATVKARPEDFFDNIEGKLVLKAGVMVPGSGIDTTAIQEVRVTRKGVRLKLYDRHRSIELLGKALGLNKERPITPDEGREPLTPDAELARKLAFLLQRGAEAAEAPR